MIVRQNLGLYILCTVLILGLVAGFDLPGAFGAGATQNLSSQVIVGNAAPAVSAVSLNGGSAIVLTPNATTSFNISYTIQDANGCGEVFFSGNVTTTVYRSGVGAACSASDLNCYITATVATHTCPFATSSQSSANATSAVSIYYFAQATDASSSFSGENWLAAVATRDVSNSTHTATSSAVELNTLTALNVTTSTINYGTLAAGANTGSTNQVATTSNAGNSSTTLRLHTSGTLTSGGNSISTSSQRYSTSTFTYAGTSTALSDSAVTVGGFFLTSPTSTGLVARPTYWGLDVPGGTATGTYTGTNVFTSLWQP